MSKTTQEWIEEAINEMMGMETYNALKESSDKILGFHFDRNGKPLTNADYMLLFTYQPYKVLRKEKVGELLVSTVWLGLNHSYENDTPIIFETMVFENDTDSVYTERYATEQQALMGHGKALVWARTRNVSNKVHLKVVEDK